MRVHSAVVLIASGSALGCVTNEVSNNVVTTDTGAPATDATIDGRGDAVSTQDAVGPDVDANTKDAPDVDVGDEVADASPDSVPLADGSQEAMSADSEPHGCTPDPGVCPLLGVDACAGWDCDAGLTLVGSDPCARAGEQSVVPGETAYACGPYWVGGYIGDPAGAGCVRFTSNWCGIYGSPALASDAGLPPQQFAYACPPDAGPPYQPNCIQIISQSSSAGWCCNTSPKCSPWGGSPRCDSTSATPQTYLGFGGAVPIGCTPLADATAPTAQGILYCCPVSTDGGPGCQP